MYIVYLCLRYSASHYPMSWVYPASGTQACEHELLLVKTLHNFHVVAVHKCSHVDYVTAILWRFTSSCNGVRLLVMQYYQCKSCRLHFKSMPSVSHSKAKTMPISFPWTVVVFLKQSVNLLHCGNLCEFPASRNFFLQPWLRLVIKIQHTLQSEQVCTNQNTGNR